MGSSNERRCDIVALVVTVSCIGYVVCVLHFKFLCLSVLFPHCFVLDDCPFLWREWYRLKWGCLQNWMFCKVDCWYMSCLIGSCLETREMRTSRALLYLICSSCCFFAIAVLSQLFEVTGIFYSCFDTGIYRLTRWALYLLRLGCWLDCLLCALSCFSVAHGNARVLIAW